MKRRLFFIAVAVAVLVIGTNLITRGPLISGKVKGFIVETARKELGLDTGMDRLVFNFFPTYIDVDKPYIRGWDDSDPSRTISADRVRVYFSLAALINREVHIRRVQVDGLSADVVKLPDGRYNIEGLKKKIEDALARKKAAQKGAKPGLEVNEIVLLDANISYSDKAQGVVAHSGKAGADLRMPARGNYWISFKADGCTIRKGDGSPVSLSAAGSVDYDNGRAKIEKARLETQGAAADASGVIVLAKAPFLDLKVKANADLSLLERFKLMKSGPKGVVEVSGTVKGAYPDLKGSGSFSLKKAEYAGVRLDDIYSQVALDRDSIVLTQIESRLLGGWVKGSLAARLRPGITYASSLTFGDINTGNFTESRKELRFIPWQVLSGRMDITGSGLSASGLTVSGSLDAKKYERQSKSRYVSEELSIIKDAHLDYKYQNGVITVQRGQADSTHSGITFAGTVGLDGKTDLSFKGHSGNIGEISTLIGYSDIKGSLDVTGYAQGKIAEPDIFGKAQITDAYAHGIPFKSASGDVKLSGWRLSFSNFLINQDYGSFVLNGGIMFKGQGTFKEPYFQAKLDVRKADARKIIAIFYDDIPVNLTAEGQIAFSGNTKKYTGEAHLKVNPGDVYGQPVDQGEVDATLNEKGLTFPKVVAVRGKDIITASGGIGFDNTFYGKATSARVNLDNFSLLMKTGVPAKGSISLAVSGEGTFDRPVIKANVASNRLYLKDVDLGAGDVVATIKNSAMALSGRLLGGKVSLDGTLALGAPYGWRGRLTFNEGHFEPFLKFVYDRLPEDVELVSTGVMAAQGALDDPRKTAVSLDFSKLAVGLMGRKLKNDGDINLRYADGRLNVKSFRLKGDQLEVQLTGGAKGLEEVETSLLVKGELGLIKPFIKDNVDFITGYGQADLRMRGEIANPLITGKVRVSDAGIKFKDFPQRFDKINGEAKIDNSGFTLTGLNADFGGGKVSLKGSGSLKGFELYNYTFNASGKGVKLRYPEGLSSTVDGDISLEGARGRQDITGEVVIKKARYSERIDWKTWLVRIKKKRPEVQVQEKGPFTDASLNVHISGPESIKVDNNVARITITPDITLRGTVGQPVVLGRLESAGGTVYFRNNQFQLQNGVAEFADPRKLNPIIDLQAETKVKEYTIQLNLSGTLDRIKVTLASDPPLKDSDIVALLTLGRTSESIAGKEGAITTGEATSFVTGQIQDAVESRVKMITGFDRFQIDPYVTSTGTSSGPRLTIGKSLFSDKLIFTYSSNIGTSEDQFVQLEYIFNKNWSAVAERDELGHVGADLKYRFEFK